MRVLRVQLIALITALAVLLPAVGGAGPHFFCHMMNRVVETCCCEVAPNHGDEAVCAKVSGAECCERLAPAARAAAVKATGDDFSIPTAAIATVIPASVYVTPRTPGFTFQRARARGPPWVGRPRFIVNCSLLT